jgi:sugar O-acyltransferase (sialic acid O-acetyltransferase NeuD family)
MAKVVLFGNTDYTQVVWWYLENDSEHEVVSFKVNKEYLEQDELCGLPVVPFEEITRLYPPEEYKMFIAVGYARRNQIRAQLYNSVRELGYELISYVHSSAINQSSMPIGDNCFIAENVVIVPFASFGNNVVIWTSSTLAHHSRVGDHCFISHHAAISGHVKVGDYCFIGANAAIRDGISIAESCVIGAGATILEDTKANGVYKSQSTPEDSYLSENLKRI